MSARGARAAALAVAAGVVVASTAAAQNVTVQDEVRIRRLDGLTPSPDRSRYAVFIRRADPARNAFESGWYVGDLSGALIRVAEGGEVRPQVMFTGHTPGRVNGGPVRWSPDGRWIAYLLRRDGQTQLWRSRAEGGVQEQLTTGAGDVVDFRWTANSQGLIIGVAPPRTELAQKAEARARAGYRFDEDFWLFTDLMGPQLVVPPPEPAKVEVVDAVSRALRPATSDEARILQAAAAPIRDARIENIVEAEDGHLSDCAAMSGDRVVCLRDDPGRAPHVAVAEVSRGVFRVLADPNADFSKLSRGRIERIEWDTPRLPWNLPGGALAGLYPSRTHGYVLYPPDFDPKKTYPVFIDPYVPDSFDTVGAEHALHAYAASGMIVLRAGFPSRVASSEGFRSITMTQLYDAKLDFPHLTMLAESTLAALDLLAARGFVDRRRVGVGGVSHGTFVPLFIMQRHDRITAISMSSPHWGPLQYYGPTAKARAFTARLGPGAAPNPDTSADYYARLDAAADAQALEAPILMNLAAQESYALVRLIRKLADAGLPYDAYVFPGESHIKWQPAHLSNIATRNLDWFRFWLQDAEDPDPAKAEQYAKWRKLREMQCANPRSLRNYCRAASPEPFPESER